MDAKTKTKAAAGLKSGEAIVGLLSKVSEGAKGASRKFMADLHKFSTMASPYLKALGPIVHFALLFLPSETDKLRKEMLERFDKIDKKLNIIEDKLDKLPATIKWVAERSKYNDYVSTINIFDNKLMELKDSTEKEAKRKEMLTSYENSYNLAGSKLADQLIGNPQFVDTIIDSYLKHKGYDRKEVIKFMSASLDHLLKASQVEIIMLELMGVNENFMEEEVKNWKNKFDKVAQKFADWNEKANNDYTIVEQNLKSELDNYLNDPKMLNLDAQTFVNQVRDKLDDKIFWQDWVVFSYMASQNHHCFTEDKFMKQRSYVEQGKIKRQLLVFNVRPGTSSQKPGALNCNNYRTSTECWKMICGAKTTIEKSVRNCHVLTVYEDMHVKYASTNGGKVKKFNMETCSKCKFYRIWKGITGWETYGYPNKYHAFLIC